ncbi:helix-turn-helix domain-containing protein [Streptomyces bullii]|uniref:Helix-turn-helix domain-containing protein n=1 Tax=Streptomyces bullii TaxID=349910 RepID=A0ABW0UY53_9ACTN
MGNEQPLPREAGDATEFVACMRRLKDQAGLTYRQLEANAAKHGDVLARSTVADVLRRSSLPRPEVVAAFVRACRAGEDTAAWLEARNRLAAAERAVSTQAGRFGPETGNGAGTQPGARTEPGTGSKPAAGWEPGAGTGSATGARATEPPRRPSPRRQQDAVAPPTVAAHPTAAQDAAARAARRRNRRQAVAGAVAAALVLSVLGAWTLLRDETGGRADPAASTHGEAPWIGVASTPALPEDVRAALAGPSRIRPAGAPQLCVTEGHDRQGHYRSQVAVQRPCVDATPPQTSLAPAGNGGAFYIQWRHPVRGVGCLTALGSGHVVEGLLEPWPWESCSADRTSQQFLIEPLGRPGTDRYRIRLVHNGMCLGVNGDDDRAEGAEIAQQRCTGARDQEFLVDTDL